MLVAFSVGTSEIKANAPVTLVCTFPLLLLAPNSSPP
jgi:hypothetical protein